MHHHVSELKQVYAKHLLVQRHFWLETNLNFHHPLHQCNAKQWAFCWGGAETVILWCAHCKRLYLYLYHAWTCTPWIIITSAVRGGWFAKVWRIDTTESNQGIELSLSKKPLAYYDITRSLGVPTSSLRHFGPPFGPSGLLWALRASLWIPQTNTLTVG